MHHAVPIELAAAGAGAKYNSIWGTATICAAMLTVLSAFLLYRLARNVEKKARPTRTYV